MSATDKWLLDTGESGRNENLMRSSCFLYLEQVQKALLSLIIWLEYNWFDYAEEDAEDKEYIIDLHNIVIEYAKYYLECRQHQLQIHTCYMFYFFWHPAMTVTSSVSVTGNLKPTTRPTPRGFPGLKPCLDYVFSHERINESDY